MRCEECAKPAVAAVPAASPRSRRPILVAALGAVLLLGVLVVLVASRSPGSTPAKALPPTGSWLEAPSLATIRGTATLVVLRDGQALATGGGVGGIALAAAEAFEPQSGRWHPVAPLHQARRGHQAVVLQDGRVLVAGGLAEGRPLASAEVYDPATQQWSPTGPMSSSRLGCSLTVLTDGRVLAAGGTPGGETGDQAQGPVATAEIYDPASGRWAASSPMATPRFEHTATLLEDGRVLIAGGQSPGAEARSLASTELFDPAAGSFVRSSDLSEARANHGAAVLADKTVLVVGGIGGQGAALGSAEVFDPRRGSWTKVGRLAQARTGSAATALADGRVLVAGGESVEQGTRQSLATAEVFDPAAGSWRSAGQMRCPRSEEATALLGDGTVLVVAGDAAFPGQAPLAQSCTDRYQPAPTRSR